jgi:hypothetical protein
VVSALNLLVSIPTAHFSRIRKIGPRRAYTSPTSSAKSVGTLRDGHLITQAKLYFKNHQQIGLNLYPAKSKQATLRIEKFPARVLQFQIIFGGVQCDISGFIAQP